ncbi:MAG: flavodoxin domain-containing protein [Salinivirgaceae bacterium]|nr:flavodoxin domain-containing protein [Salinivirgaceae bacterium]
MKTLIVYASKHGTTKKVASAIAEKLSGQTDIVNLRNKEKPDLSAYDQLIIGGSIHAGGIQEKVRRFCKANTVLLLQKPLALYISCMDDEKAQEQIENAYPQVLRNHAISIKHVGGAFLFDKMTFLERMIVKKITGISTSVNKINEDNINELINEINNSHHETE